jgi:Ca2+-binding RTX toxin-like protein
LESDLLVGGGDDDFLNGGVEQDTLATGGGTDTIVDTENDVIDEAFVNWYVEGFVAP